MKGHDEFDDLAEDYDATLNQGLAVSGENKTYFARERILWLAKELAARSVNPRAAIDFGCGTGSSVPLLLDLLKLEDVLGVDTSERSIEVARRTHGSSRARFSVLRDHAPSGGADLAFCNGVFHHIPVSERAGAIAHVRQSLRPGGLWSFWENNPLNPGTRWIMSRLPFDRDAVTLTCRHAEALLRAGGFEILRSDHLFIFPRLLRALRPLEPSLAGLPIGAQYQVLCRRVD
jgi:SAM-dependent methyltransferase